MYGSRAMPRQCSTTIKEFADHNKQKPKHWGLSYRMISGNHLGLISRETTQDCKNKRISLNKCEMIIKLVIQSLICQRRIYNSDYNVLKEANIAKQR